MDGIFWCYFIRYICVIELIWLFENNECNESKFCEVFFF